MSDELRSLRVPVWCPMCDGTMRGRSTGTWYDWGVCVICYIDFIETREDRWRSGWRPDKEQVAASVASRDEDFDT